MLDINETYTWDFIIDNYKLIKQFADELDVAERYLIYHTNFVNGVTTNNKTLSVKALIDVSLRLEEIK